MRFDFPRRRPPAEEPADLLDHFCELPEGAR